MTPTDIPPPSGPGKDALTRIWESPRGLALVSAVNQTQIGRRYVITAFIFFLIGGLMALLMRSQLAFPESDVVGHELYNQLFTMHGTTMLFLFAVPMVEGAAIYLLPQMLGARDLSFPRLSAFGYWAYLFGGILLYASLLFGLMPDTGWTMYTPLSGSEYSPDQNVDFWLIGITLVEIGSITAAAEIAVTILKARAPGMSLNRLPLFAWYMLVTSFMILFGFPPLIMGDLLLEIERSLDWPFFDVSRGGDDLLWQHLFWIFGHPEVYIIFLPAAGFVSMIIAPFTQRPTVGYYWLVAAALGTGFVSFGLWVHHMFATGIPLVSLGFFSAASMTVSIFAGIQVFAWLATLWLGKPILKTPLLFVAGFIFLFVAGGLTGVMHAAVPFDWQTHSSYFLVAHFHYVLFGGMVFPLFAAFYYWFPLETGRMMSETLGKWNFWLLFIGFNLTFFPMHIAGLLGMPRRIYTYPEGSWEWENLTATIGSYLIGAAVLLFLFNLLRSYHKGTPSGGDPWNAGTLEWATPLPTPPYNFRSIPRIKDRYPMWEQAGLSEYLERGEDYLPEPKGGLRLGTSVKTVSGRLENFVTYPSKDYAPLAAALGLVVLFVGVLFRFYWVAGLGAGAFTVAVLVWLWRHPLVDEKVRGDLSESLGVPLGVDAPHSVGWWGMVMTVLGDATLFVSLVFAYFYLWTRSPSWPPGGTPGLDGTWPAAGVVALLVGSVFLWLSWQRADRGGPLLLGGTVLALLSGLGYGVLQLATLVWSGLEPQEHAYNALVYALVSFNLLHVGIAVLMLGFAIAYMLLREPGLLRRLVLANVALFWLYTVGMGVITSAVVYLWPLVS